ncbi:beta-1,3-galactosyltransferase 6 isoform X1 [Manduca sexta]|uniref:beta-1,3-galactosyltransferase 6 isoform X1 n=2 Tax=Manduca sexta TaxID=7130 RepID=UPI00188E1DBA|nr:beta-1,3-galactosyltransferase 6 isoform X1 [Manduca sexta]
MFLIYLRKYKIMILFSVFFFYIGCGITLSFLRMDCADALSKTSKASLLSIPNVEYAVLITSAPVNEKKRDAIRATWGKFATNIFLENGEVLYKWNHSQATYQTQHEQIKFYFCIGTEGLTDNEMQKLIDENKRSTDLLLLENLKDSYQNLTKKILLTMKWFSQKVKGLKYVIKCDDDSFVRVDLIIRELEAFAPEMSSVEINKYVTHKRPLNKYQGLYWGYFNGKARVYLKGKWEEKDWFLCDNYLPYALGGGYVISSSIVQYIGNNAEFLRCYNSEDVSMGVWTAALDGINRVHDVRFDTEWKSRGCTKDMLVRHKQTPSDMFLMYKTLVETHGEQLCKTENTVRRFYYYNWNVLPSSCCK